MTNFSNRYGLPIKYAAYAALGGGLGYYLFSAFGFQFSTGVLSVVVATAVGGFVGGLIRQQRNKDK